MFPRTPIQIVNSLVRDYQNGLNIKSLIEKYNLSRNTCARYLKAANIKIRHENKNSQKWKVDENYFNVINTKEKAYWLGFIFADGNVYLGKKNYFSAFNFNLTKSDGYMVEKLAKAVSYTGKTTIKKYKNPNYDSAVSLTICNKKFCENLIEKGCVPAKSLILEFPSESAVPEEFMSHFVRGYFDGDGCVAKKNKNTNAIFVSIIGTKSMMEGISRFLHSKGIKSNIHIHRKLHTLTIHMMDRVRLFFLLIYELSDSCFLERKRKKFVENLNEYGFYKVSKGNFEKIITNLWSEGAITANKPSRFFPKLIQGKMKNDDGWSIKKLSFT